MKAKKYSIDIKMEDDDNVGIGIEIDGKAVRINEIAAEDADKIVRMVSSTFNFVNRFMNVNDEEEYWEDGDRED